MKDTLIIGDTHLPFAHPAYLAFCRDIAEAWGVERVIHIGDVVDCHAVSLHGREPDAPGVLEEWDAARKQVETWAKAFPEVTVITGNHETRIARVAAGVGIPGEFLRSPAELWGVDGWEWVDELVDDSTLFTHGTGCGGLDPAANLVRRMGMSVVIGHHHSAGGVSFHANPLRRFWGVNVGCGVDDRAVALRYAQNNSRKSVLGCAVIVGDTPFFEPMPCGHGERYCRTRFKKGKRR